MSGWPALHPDDESGETIRVHPSGFEPQPRVAIAAAVAAGAPSASAATSGPPYERASTSGPPYTSVSSGGPYGAPYPATPTPSRPRSIAPMFMITVMVLSVVAGAVAVVYLLAGDRDNADRPAPAAAASVSASVSASASASGAVDSCLVGEWQGTLMKWADPPLSTDQGAVLRLRADGTGDLDFGSGVSLKGTVDGEAAEAMLIGKLTFRFSTLNGTVTYTDLQIDARMVLFRSGRIVLNELVPAEEMDPEKYTCTGDIMTTTSDGDVTEYRRR